MLPDLATLDTIPLFFTALAYLPNRCHLNTIETSHWCLHQVPYSILHFLIDIPPSKKTPVHLYFFNDSHMRQQAKDIKTLPMVCHWRVINDKIWHLACYTAQLFTTSYLHLITVLPIVSFFFFFLSPMMTHATFSQLIWIWLKLILKI